ncbi:GspH/FimT family pseudopilin [Shewanella algidipiscicola]|uniref:Type II secretion system protein H n=1 Tax=Shewanella algidipiscicola TaxID=614070 RepID=A0ABQ4PJQ0_9GAMM|nr:GspH/FimT family pseudopilin [Shewanella algidipiscicola]GIU47903.1 type IV pilus biogenesis protein FimU [Shewanella algidipiscicola]
MRHPLQGFTLVELMVTIVIAGILLTIGAPSLISVYEGVRANNNIEKIHNIMAFARNQAISYGTRVNVCPFASATSCGATTDWSGGIRVFINANGTETELRAIDGFNSQDAIKGPSGNITFSSEGLSSGGTIIYCPDGKADSSQSINISSSGLISYGSTGITCS